MTVKYEVVPAVGNGRPIIHSEGCPFGRVIARRYLETVKVVEGKHAFAALDQVPGAKFAPCVLSRRPQ